MVSLAISASLLVAVIPEGTAVTSADFNIRAIADSVIVLIVCAVLFREPLHDVRTEFGRLAGKRSDPDLDEDITKSGRESDRSTQRSGRFRLQTC